MASPGNRHCANCIGALSIPIAATWFDKYDFLSVFYGDLRSGRSRRVIRR